ncbi:MAG: imidazolonepropionase [Bacteroidota bacterium]|nr:imidazolonepropionase [Bacteroidota bacterium]
MLRGGAMADLPVIQDAWIALSNGVIYDFGAMSELSGISAIREIDARDRFVFPSFTDSHTHLVFADSREDEFVMKIKGKSYHAIAASGGGILNSAKKIQRLEESELYMRCLPRLEEIIRTGTGAVEIKSGYGLTLKDELKMLRVARRIRDESPLTVKITFLGAHAVPEGMDKSSYVRLVKDEMIPAVASEKLADYVDVFCEHGFFSDADTREILEAGLRYGLKGRVHANQLSRSGGVQAGVACGAVSVDHLENIGQEEIDALKNTNTIPTALPGAAFFLGLPFPPARQMLDEGLPLAIASDYNPGSSPSGNMPLMVSLACIRMKLTPEEAFNATTLNTAAALELSDTHGSITRGKVANLFITKPMPSLAYMPYVYGTSMVETVILNGKVY